MTRAVAAITGMGATTCLGPGVAALWRGAAEGRCVAESPAPDPASAGSALDLALSAAREALITAGDRSADSATCLAIGTNVGRLSRSGLSADGTEERIGPLLGPGCPEGWADHHVLARQMQQQLGLGGGEVAFTAACASSSLALGHAFDLVASGGCDRVLAGGSDVLTEFKLAGHRMLGSAGRSGYLRPFDTHRDGTVLRDGAGFLVLESMEACRARGARPLAYLTGYGVATDTGSLTAPDPSGGGARRAMLQALDDAGLTAEQVDLVQAHGTGTKLNDAIEARAIREVFGRRPGLSVSADKGSIGHTLGACGALSLILAISDMLHATVPPAAGCDEQDPECDIPLVTGTPLRREIRAALCNSFGFGGSNVSLLVERAEGRS